MKTKVLIGIGMGCCCSISLMASIATFFAVLNLAVIRKKSPVYLISFTNITSDIVWISMYFIFLVPSVIADQWLYPGTRGELFSNIVAFIINNCWYGTSFLQILMAINRLVVICFSKSDIFTYNVLRVLAPMMLVPFGSLHALIQQELLPCCRISLDPSRATYGFEILPNVTNYSNIYLAFPTNLVTSATAIVCYSIVNYIPTAKLIDDVQILLYVHRHSVAFKDTSAKKRHSDIGYAIQFCAISMFHLFAWTSVRFLPGIIANMDGGEHLYSISTFMIICDGSVNSFVYLIFNREVRHALGQGRFLTREVTTSANHGASMSHHTMPLHPVPHLHDLTHIEN